MVTIKVTSVSRRIIICQLSIDFLNCHILREAFTDSQTTLILFQSPLFFFFFVFIKICNHMLTNIDNLFLGPIRTETTSIGFTIADTAPCRVPTHRDDL